MPVIYNSDIVFPNLDRSYTNDYIGDSYTLPDNLYFQALDIADTISADSRALWEREDSAYQRMVEDMKKAGLNPWAGISSGGSATGNINPSLDSLTGLLNVLGSWMDKEDLVNKRTGAWKNIADLFQKLLTGIGAML